MADLYKIGIKHVWQPLMTSLKDDPSDNVEQVALRTARFEIGQIVKHLIYPFRGVIFDVDPVFNSTEEWWQSIPEDVRPAKDQPFYHLLAENDQTAYIAYVSEQNLLADDSGNPISHPQVKDFFRGIRNGRYVVADKTTH